MKCTTLSITQGDVSSMREEENYSFLCGPACVSFRKMSLVQVWCTEDDIQSLEPSAKISALPLSPFKSNFQPEVLGKN